MRKTIKTARATVRWVKRILEVQLPMAGANGLRTGEDSR
jgi:hypothetical protein